MKAKTKYYQIGITTFAILLASFSSHRIASAQSGSINVDPALGAVGGNVSEIAGEVSSAIAGEVSSAVAGEAISGDVSAVAGEVSAISGNVGENIGNVGETTFFDDQGTTADFAITEPQNSIGQFDSIYESTPSGCCGEEPSSSGCCGAKSSTSRGCWAKLFTPKCCRAKAPTSGSCGAGSSTSGCCGVGSSNFFSNPGWSSSLAPRTLTILGGIEVGSDPPGFGFADFFPIVDDDLERYALSLAIGRRHRNWLRTETELAFRSHNDAFAFSDGFGGFFAEGSDTDVISLMRNVILEWNNNSRFTPYGGMGIGVSYVNADSVTLIGGTPFLGVDDNDTVFSWQAIAGVATKVRSNLDFVFEYRYFATADVTLDFFDSGEFVAQNLFFGARLHF